MPQKPLYNKQQMRMIIKRQLEAKEYNSLIHFVFLNKPFNSEIPGTYSVYHMVEGGMIVATNAACINEWLVEHNMPTRPPMSDYTIFKKHAVDNRTETSVNLKYTAPKHESSELHVDVWHWYTAGVSIREISDRIHCTAANVHYYIKKYKKLNPEWEKEVDI